MSNHNELHLVVITICSTAIMALAYAVMTRQRASPTLVVREAAVIRMQGQMNDLVASVKDLTNAVNQLSEDVASSRKSAPSTCPINSVSDDELLPEPKSRLPSIESSECGSFVLVPPYAEDGEES